MLIDYLCITFCQWEVISMISIFCLLTAHHKLEKNVYMYFCLLPWKIIDKKGQENSVLSYKLKILY